MTSHMSHASLLAICFHITRISRFLSSSLAAVWCLSRIAVTSPRPYTPMSSAWGSDGCAISQSHLMDEFSPPAASPPVVDSHCKQGNSTQGEGNPCSIGCADIRAHGRCWDAAWWSCPSHECRGHLARGIACVTLPPEPSQLTSPGIYKPV